MNLESLGNEEQHEAYKDEVKESLRKNFPDQLDKIDKAYEALQILTDAGIEAHCFFKFKDEKWKIGGNKFVRFSNSLDFIRKDGGGSMKQATLNAWETNYSLAYSFVDFFSNFSPSSHPLDSLRYLFNGSVDWILNEVEPEQYTKIKNS